MTDNRYQFQPRWIKAWRWLRWKPWFFIVSILHTLRGLATGAKPVDYEDMEFDVPPYANALKRGEKVWRTNDGRIIPVEKMTDSHLINTYLFLERRNCVPPRVIQVYMSSPGPQGDYAQMAFDAEFDRVLDKRPCIQMEWIEDEIKRRGLDPHNPDLWHKLKNRTHFLRKMVNLG